MKHKLLAVALLPMLMLAQKPSGKQLILSLHKLAKPCKSLSFKQTTNKYHNDSLKSASTWTEYLEYPDKLRIEFGDTANRNFVVFKNDSAWNYRGNTFIEKHEDKNLIMLLLGGLYYRDTDDVLKRITAAGIDTDVVSEQTWNKEVYFVIGAELNDLSKTQIWIHKSKMRIDRFIENDKGTVIDVRVVERKKACDTEIESRLDIYLNGKLYQQELYYDIEYDKAIPAIKFQTKE